MTESQSLPLRLTYDTEVNPLSFDFVLCLAICRVVCQMNKFPDKFDVVIVSRAFRNVGVEGLYSAEYRERKLRDVLVTTAMLCKWVNTVHVVRGDTPVPPYAGPTIPTAEALKYVGKALHWQITPMVMKQMEELYNNGGKLPDYGFQASREIFERYKAKLKNAVVYHPRVSKHNPGRNSNKELMRQLTGLLRADGLDVCFVPDIEDIRAGFTWGDMGAEPLIEAAFDFEVRLAVAEAALTNLIYSGGGNGAMFHFAPVSFFWTGFLDENDRVVSTPFFHEKGSTMGLNPPWLDPVTQLCDWTPKAQVDAPYIRRYLLDLIGVLRSRAP